MYTLWDRKNRNTYKLLGKIKTSVQMTQTNWSYLELSPRSVCAATKTGHSFGLLLAFYLHYWEPRSRRRNWRMKHYYTRQRADFTGKKRLPNDLRKSVPASNYNLMLTWNTKKQKRPHDTLDPEQSLKRTLYWYS